MRHPLEVKLRRYRSRMRVYSTLTASGRLLAVYAIVLLSLATIDWYFRPTSPGVRVSFWLLALAPLLYLPVSLYQAARRCRSSVELAQDLERALPSLRNWLAGAIDFLYVKREDPTAGSKELRGAVIDRATELSAELDFSTTLNRRPLYRSLGTMTLVLGTVAIIVALHPAAAFTASRRLAQPLGPITWPRKTMLIVKKTPTRLARGSSFQAIVADEYGRTLPEQATIFYRYDQEKDVAAENMKPDENKPLPAIEAETIRTDGQQIVPFRDRIDRSFSYRVTSGDDDRMPWQAVTVVEPPTVESFKVEVTPPSYVGDCESATLPVTDKTSVREGSKVQFIATVSKPVRRATLFLGEMEYEGEVGEKGRQILFPVGTLDPSTMIDHACSIALRLEDRLGLEVTVDRSQQIELIENSPPIITLLRPGNNERVVSGAVVPVEASVEDDLGVRSVVLYWTVSGTSGIRSFAETIFQGPDKFLKTLQKVGACPASKQKFTPSYRWNLAPLKLAVDDRLSLHVVATDYSDLSTASEPIDIVVVDPASFVNRLASEQRAITDEMAQALAISVQNRRRMLQVRQQLEHGGEVRTASVDLLRAVMLDRRQVVRTLTDENDGLIARSSSILTQLDNSQLQASSLRNRLVRLIANLETLRGEVLPIIEQSTTRAVKNAELALDPQSDITVEMPEILTPLSTAILGQERLIVTLKAMLGRLDDLVDYQRFCDDLKRLIQSQRTLTDQTKTLGRSLLGRVRTSLEPTELTRLDQASRDQARIARESGQTIARMVQAARRANEGEENRIALAVATPEARSIGTTLARASESISQNQLGRAVKLQIESLDQLEAMLNQMTQTAGPATGGPSSEQPIQIEGSKPGNTSEQNGKTDGPTQKNTTDKPGNQTSEATSLRPKNPSHEATTHLKPRTVDDIIERVWGELPDREREPLLQLPGERFLPGYERQIESYYNRLLDQ